MYGEAGLIDSCEDVPKEIQKMPFSWTWGQNKDFRSSGDILELVMFEFSVDACCQSLEGRSCSSVFFKLAVPFMLSQVVVQVAERESKRGQRHAPTLGCADSSFMAPMGQVDIQHCLRVSGFADISPCISDCWLTRFQYSSIRRLFPHPGMAQDIHGCNRYWMKRTIGNKMRGTLENHGLGSKPAFTTSSLNIAKTLLTADGSSPLNHASKSAAETEDANSFKIFGLPSKGANSQPGEAPRRFIIEPTKKVYIHHSR
ncbi:MAG: hypothetical protein J3Q66DRAFT_425718 [Benniella sp.]|nr:MAG: hypothetical protein J3Q66DRAFT_425718 [Benniella sp.]